MTKNKDDFAAVEIRHSDADMSGWVAAFDRVYGSKDKAKEKANALNGMNHENQQLKCAIERIAWLVDAKDTDVSKLSRIKANCESALATKGSE